MERKCSNCGSVMDDAGDMKFRIDGYAGVAGFFLGGFNQLSEDIQEFTIFKCPKCGKVDFYEPINRQETDKKHHIL